MTEGERILKQAEANVARLRATFIELELAVDRAREQLVMVRLLLADPEYEAHRTAALLTGQVPESIEVWRERG